MEQVNVILDSEKNKTYLQIYNTINITNDLIMVNHILNGDSLIRRFLSTGLAGNMIVTRECLIDGDLKGNTLPEFYAARAKYIETTYHESEESYYERVVSEYEKIMTAPNHSEFNLWFGYDLFCRANMWFIISLLYDLQIKKEVFVVYPSYLKDDNIWKDFGGATPEDLIACFNKRIRFNDADLVFGENLWVAFKNGDLKNLEKLSKQQSDCFPYLQEVGMAHIERFPKNGKKGRPEKAIEEIIDGTTTDFPSVFSEFSVKEGIYGFGDLQVKQIFDKVMNNR